MYMFTRLYTFILSLTFNVRQGPIKGFVGPRHYSFVGPKLGARGTNEGAEGTLAPQLEGLGERFKLPQRVWG